MSAKETKQNNQNDCLDKENCKHNNQDNSAKKNLQP